MFSSCTAQQCIKDKDSLCLSLDKRSTLNYSNFGVFYPSKLLKHDGLFPCGFFLSFSGNIIYSEV